MAERGARRVVRVGLGPREDYELEAVEALGEGAGELVLEAYGDAVCTAVEVALSLSERFGLSIPQVRVGKRRKGSKRRVWIWILLAKPREGGGGGAAGSLE
ncbi:MAG: hypothetical protein LRS49_04410, partial [Desulfurococcales archaeon]|nr:hypothetical protein [Desulfurococcales archaeon]